MSTGVDYEQDVVGFAYDYALPYLAKKYTCRKGGTMQQMGTRMESSNGEIIYNFRGGATVLKGVVELVLVVALIGVALGFAFSRNEFLNPKITEEQVYRMRLQAEALAAQNAYEREKQQRELERQRALLQQELDWREQDHLRWQQFQEDAATLVVFALSVGWIAMSTGAGVFIACLGVARLKQRRQPSLSEGQSGIPFFPASDEHARDHFATANSSTRTDQGGNHREQDIVKQYDRDHLLAQLKVTPQAIG